MHNNNKVKEGDAQRGGEKKSTLKKKKKKKGGSQTLVKAVTVIRCRTSQIRSSF